MLSEIIFSKLLPIINEFQFTKGGPIIALQFENEFGGVKNENDFQYFSFMKKTITKSGFRELLSNCNPGSIAGRVVHDNFPKWKKLGLCHFFL